MTSGEYIDATHTWTKTALLIYTSYDGVNWKAVAEVRSTPYYNNTSLRPGSFFAHLGKIYNQNVYGAGFWGTDIYTISGSTQAITRNIVHPVYYVGTWSSAGSDSNDGRTPGTPWATLGHAMQGNHICYGARVRISSGDFTESTIDPLWNSVGATFQGDSTLSTVIEGQGAANTVLHRPVGGLYYFLNIAAAGAGCSPSVPLIAKNLKLWSPSTKSVSVGAGGGAVFNNCTLGDTNSSNPVLTVNPSGIMTVNDCLLVGNTTGGDIVSGGGFSANYSVFVNGYRSIYGTDGSLGVSLINNTFYGYTYRALEIPADMTVQAVIKNNIMIGNPITVYPIVDYSGLTETGVDYNWYSHANSNVTDGGHSITGTDPKFTNAAGDDFSLLSNSPVIGAAVNLCSTLVTATDVAGNPVCGGGAYVGEGSAPSIGAYNYTYSSGVLQAPVALGATSIIATGFTADWGATTGASGYALDVSVDSGFGTFVAGYNNMDVGNVTAAPVTGLTPGTQYYYRVRAYNGFGTSGNSNTSSCTTSTATSTLQATLTVDITGSGSVTSNPSVISCTNGNGVCGASFGDGTVVALTPAASAGFVFSGWSGGGCTTWDLPAYRYRGHHRDGGLHPADVHRDGNSQWRERWRCSFELGGCLR